DRVPGPEAGDVVADRLDHPGCIEAEHARLGFDLGFWRAHLGVDRADRYRLDPDLQVATGGSGRCEFHGEQRTRVVDGQVAGEGDGFHGVDSRGRGTGGGLSSVNMPFQYG